MVMLVFEGEELARLAEAASQASEFRKPYTKETTHESGLWLVKDNGLYVMNAHEETEPKCAFANGFDPLDLEDDPLACARAVGGDDFAEWIPLPKKILSLLAHGRDMLKIDLSDDLIKISLR